MDLVGKQVKHNKFGEGVIASQDASYISVQFATEDASKKFAYPACFKTFLKLVDADLAAEADASVRQKEKVEEEKKEQALKEAEKRYLIEKMRESRFKGSKGSNTEEPPSFDFVRSFCEKYIGAIIGEIKYLKENGSKRQKVFDGKQIEVKSGRYIYTFEADNELNYPDGTQISIWINGIAAAGQIIGCEGFTIIIESSIDLGLEVKNMEFSAEEWRLLAALIDRLNEMDPSPIVKELTCHSYQYIDHRNHNIMTGQETAVQMSTKQPITFVWGPPGTGKTYTLAKIALEHIAQGKRVLMLSYSNVSVDGAIMRVHNMNPTLEEGTIVRYGYPRQKNLVEHDYLTSYNLALRNHPELLEMRNSLLAERKKITRESKRYVEIEQSLNEIKSKLSDEEKTAVKCAKFVATTVTKATVDKTISEGDFDVVIFDEASMAYIPQIVFAASLAKENFICMGDFRQLPPIVQSSDKSILNGDIFQFCGITSAVDKGVNHEWLCLLDTQYRMHPRIADFASYTMYGGLLRSGENMEEKRLDIVRNEPMADNPIAFADLSGMMSVCLKTGDNSRVNVLSALMSFSLALETAKNHPVGIITPYNAQSRLLHAMSRDVAEANPELNQITCATVHQFQGSEQDVIVYDAVECYRMPHPGILITSKKNNYADRLFNVALTRARGKFIGVANIDYMEAKKLSRDLMFRQMIDWQKGKASCIDGSELTKKRNKISGSTMSFYNNYEGNLAFLKDIEGAKREIRIDIPDKPVEDDFSMKLARAIQGIKGKGRQVYIRAENKKTLPPVLKPYAIENPYVSNPIVIIDKKIVWFGMPSSDAEFKVEGRSLQTEYHPVIRFAGKRTATSIYGFLGMNKTLDKSTTVEKDEKGQVVADNFANYVLGNKTCPYCGEPMALRKSKKGRFFLGCTGYPNCDNTEPIDVEFVDKYIYRNGGRGQRCTRCNSSLEAKKSQYGIYVRCCGDYGHNYKLDQI